LLFVLGGCGTESDSSSETAPQVRVPPPAPAPAAPQAHDAAETEPADIVPTPGGAAETSTSPQGTDGESSRKVAEVGVGRKSQQIEGGGYIPTVIRARFRAEERINLTNAQYALKLYKAQHGQGPKTHEEYMEKIIKANRINLPELPAGQRYVYDPETEQLMVEETGEP
jgi:hypothetical protein